LRSSNCFSNSFNPTNTFSTSLPAAACKSVIAFSNSSAILPPFAEKCCNKILTDSVN